VQNVDAASKGTCRCVVEVSAFSVVNVLTTQADGTHGFAAQTHVVVTSGAGRDVENVQAPDTESASFTVMDYDGI